MVGVPKEVADVLDFWATAIHPDNIVDDELADDELADDEPDPLVPVLCFPCAKRRAS
jgi:hypothetical protein